MIKEDSGKYTEYEVAYDLTSAEWIKMLNELNLSQKSSIAMIKQCYFTSQVAILTFNQMDNCWHLSLLEGVDESLEFAFSVRDEEERLRIAKNLNGVELYNLLDMPNIAVRIRLKAGRYIFTIKFKDDDTELNYELNLHDWIKDVLFSCYPYVEKTRYTFSYQGATAEVDIYIHPKRDPRIEFEFKTSQQRDDFVLNDINATKATESNKDIALNAYYNQ